MNAKRCWDIFFFPTKERKEKGKASRRGGKEKENGGAERVCNACVFVNVFENVCVFVSVSVSVSVFMCGNISSLSGNTSVKKMKRSVGNESVSVSVSVSASASETRRTRRTSVVRNRMMEHGGRGSGSMSTMWSCCQRNYHCGGVRRNKDDVRLMRTRTFAATPAPTPPLSSPPFSSPPIQSPPSTTSISSSSFPSGFLQPVMRSPITSNRSNLKQDLDQYFKGILNAKVWTE